MKKLFILLFLFPCICIYGQGTLQAVTVPTASKDNFGGNNPASSKGYLYLPSNYTSGSIRYPVILFFHGSGEAGNNPAILLNQGLPWNINNGMKLDNIVNPSDGLSYSFIMLALQDPYNSPNATEIPQMIRWLNSNYRIDMNRIYITGLSAGGGQQMYAMGLQDSVSSLITASVPMSAPFGFMSPSNFSLIGKNHIKTWIFCGTSDTYYAQDQKLRDTCNKYYPGSSILTPYSGGHCCWTTYYDMNFKDATSGLNIYQWMLINTKAPGVSLPVRFKSIQLIKK